MGGVRLRPSLHLHFLQRSQVQREFFPSLARPGDSQPAAPRQQGGMESSLTRTVLLRQDLGRLRPSLGGRAAAAVGRQGETSSHHITSLPQSQSLSHILIYF